ncbi:MAG: hypothetical protein V1822_03645, partial [Candidatus Micrarchaeota archaeon]
MIISTSKSASPALCKKARSLASVLSYEYVRRSSRGMEKLCAIAQKKSQSFLFVLSKMGEKDALLKFSKGMDGWEWGTDALEVKNIEIKNSPASKKSFAKNDPAFGSKNVSSAKISAGAFGS